MSKLVITLLLVGCISSAAAVRVSYAGEMDILLQKLVEKGVLTPGEAQQVGTESKEQAKAEIAAAKSETLPKWLQTFKLKGDFRTRYQWEKRKGANLNGGTSSSRGATTGRDRMRMRLRVGAEAKVNDQVKVNFGLASGDSSDPRSTNQTFSEVFGKRSIWIDYAYAEYMAFSWLTARVGRMKNPLWEPSDMLWDTDINPEGVSLGLTKKFNSIVDGFFNGAWFLLDENANASDPWMLAIQPGLNFALTPDIGLKLAASYYGFNQVQGWIPTSNARSASSNTRKSGGLQYGYNTWSPSLELGINEPLKRIGLDRVLPLDIPKLSIFGEYIENMDTHNSHTGYAAGLKLGYEKIADWKQWQAKYQYVMLGTDAWLDTLPDSDRYGGRTGVRSHEVVLSYGLGKNWSLDLDYYLSQLTNSPSDDIAGMLKTENLFQADVNFKF